LQFIYCLTTTIADRRAIAIFAKKISLPLRFITDHYNILGFVSQLAGSVSKEFQHLVKRAYVIKLDNSRHFLRDVDT